MTMLYYKSTTNDPRVNLAIEEYLFNTAREDVFMLWQNRPSVILGRFQNAYEEVNMDVVQSNNVLLIRRITGGGAVYHDLGNLNYSFICHRDNNERFEFKYFMDKIVDAINAVSRKAIIDGRNDITIKGKKVSGNAQHVSGNKVLHHGTLLFDSDLEVLNKVLKEEDKGIESKASRSNRRGVTNIKEHLVEEINISAFSEIIGNTMLKGEAVREIQLDAIAMDQIMTLVRNKYSKWEWNVGVSPKCCIKRKGAWNEGHMQIQMGVENGVINEFYIEGDFFANSSFHKMLDLFVGCKIDREALRVPARKCANSILGLSDEDFISWIINDID